MEIGGRMKVVEDTFYTQQAKLDEGIESQREALETSVTKIEGQMRWLDEEHMRCRSEHAAKLDKTIKDLHSDVQQQVDQMQHEASAWQPVPDANPNNMLALKETMRRVDGLSGAVEQLCAYMGGLKMKEITLQAEERLVQFKDHFFI